MKATYLPVIGLTQVWPELMLGTVGLYLPHYSPCPSQIWGLVEEGEHVVDGVRDALSTI